MNRCDHGLARSEQSNAFFVQMPLSGRFCRCTLAPSRKVGPRAECFSLGCEHNGPARRIAVERFVRFRNFCNQRSVEIVVGRSAHLDDRNMIGDVHAQVLTHTLVPSFRSSRLIEEAPRVVSRRSCAEFALYPRQYSLPWHPDRASRSGGRRGRPQAREFPFRQRRCPAPFLLPPPCTSKTL